MQTASIRTDPDEERKRADAISLLGRGDLALLETVWAGLADKPAYRWLRPPEIGLVMVRARAGGTGQPFNLGEMTVTRATVRLDGEPALIGFAYVAGRAKRHAELASLFEALLQRPSLREQLQASLLAPLAEAAAANRAQRAEQVAATRVDFTTMVRGDD
jgi:alpha-D-ribose 1-methylphosphonate 5-triphosphate synthase subunit PhnG